MLSAYHGYPFSHRRCTSHSELHDARDGDLARYPSLRHSDGGRCARAASPFTSPVETGYPVISSDSVGTSCSARWVGPIRIISSLLSHPWNLSVYVRLSRFYNLEDTNLSRGFIVLVKRCITTASIWEGEAESDRMWRSKKYSVHVFRVSMQT